jgi:hypothetical protein
MISETAGAPARTSAPATLLIGLLAVAGIAIRLVAIAEPLGIDQSLWASAVRGMAHGQRLYHDVWEQRPPGIYWIYLAGFRVFGWTPAAVAWLDILASAATCLLLAAIVRPLSNTRTATVAAALYAWLTTPAWLYGHGGFLERSVCETFIVLCVAFAAWSGVRIWQGSSIAAALGMGLAAGAAVVLKPNAGLYFPALLLWAAVYARRPGMPLLFVASIAAAAVVPVAALIWLWRFDLLHDARVAVVDFNRFYVGQGFSATAYAADFAKAVWLRIKTDPLWLAGTIASVAALAELAHRRKLSPLAALAMVWGAASAAVIVVNGARLFNSYFINALPPLTLMAAWLLGDGWRRGRGQRAVAAGTIVLMAALLVHRDYAGRVFDWTALDFEWLRGKSNRTAYLDEFGGYANDRGYSARANEELAAYVHEHTLPDERVFLFGISGAGVYFGSERLTAHRFLRVNFFVDIDFPDPDFRLEPVIATLTAARPRYLIFERLHGRSTMAQAADGLPGNPVVQPLLSAYRLETEIEDFALYRRTD